jgi:WD40 repeat protein
MEHNYLAKITYINTECSPSHLFNNLTLTDSSLYYIHNSEIQPRVIVIDRKFFDDAITENLSKYVSKLNSNETNEMVVVKRTCINNKYFIAVGLYGGFKLWSSDGERLLYQIPAKVKVVDKPYAFTSICEYKYDKSQSGYDSIICTDNYGQIFSILGFNQMWKHKLLYSNEGVTTTCCCSGLNTDIFAVGFETGEIFLFNFNKDEQVELLTKLDNFNNLPALSMCIINNSSSKKNILVNCYLNGEIRLHDLSSNKYELIVSLGAHLRLITSIDSVKNCFVTCGDDCFVNVWKFDEENNIQNKGNYELKDKMPVGACIIEKPGNKIDIFVSVYDSCNLALIQDINI